MCHAPSTAAGTSACRLWLYRLSRRLCYSSEEADASVSYAARLSLEAAHMRSKPRVTEKQQQ